MVGESELVVLGVVTRAHGVRGEVRVKPFHEESDLLLQTAEVVMRHDGEARPVRVRAARPHQRAVLMWLEGCEDRDRAERLRGAQICLPRAALPPLAEDEFYYADVPGLAVVTVEGEEVGRALDVAIYPSADAIRVQTADGVLEIPMLAPYLVEVDPERGFIVVDEIGELELVP